MAYSDAQKEATARYNKKAYDRINLIVRKGKRKRIAEYAASHEPLYQRRHRRAAAAGKAGRIKFPFRRSKTGEAGCFFANALETAPVL